MRLLLALIAVVIVLFAVQSVQAGTACDPACAPACAPAEDACTPADCATCPANGVCRARVGLPLLRATVAAPVRVVRVATAPVRWIVKHKPLRSAVARVRANRSCCR